MNMAATCAWRNAAFTVGVPVGRGENGTFAFIVHAGPDISSLLVCLSLAPGFQPGGHWW